MAIGIDYFDSDSIITVMGVGGGGGNAVNNMIESGLDSVKFVVANTDKQAMDKNKAKIKIPLGEGTMGAGANPEVGEKSAEFSINEIKEHLKGTEMLFITAGMGGGTGTGASPVIARTARQMGILTVAIVSSPFIWEGKGRQDNAKRGIEKLRENVDALIIVPNNRLLDIINQNITFVQAYKMVDEILLNATKGISDIIAKVGHVNVDFADVKTIMSNMGDALMGLGKATGQNKAQDAAKAALNSPLLDGVTIRGSKGVLVNITGGVNIGMMDVAAAVGLIHDAAGADANIIHGVVLDESLEDEIHVTVVATGFRHDSINEGQFDNKTSTIINERPDTKTDPYPPKPAPKPNQIGSSKLDDIKSPPNPFGTTFSDGGSVVKTPIPDLKTPRGQELRGIETPTYLRKMKSAPDMSLIGTANQSTYRRMNEINFSNLIH